MNIESIGGSLSHDEKLQAMELIWQELAKSSPGYPSPAWHEKVIEDRLSNPAPGRALGLDNAKAEILANLNARRTQG